MRMQIGVSQPVLDSGAQVFVRHVDARNAFVIRRQYDRHARRTVQIQGMLATANSQNAIVAAQIDLDRNAFPRHAGHDGGRIILIGDIDAVAYPPGTHGHRLRNMKAQVCRGHQAQGQLTRMQCLREPSACALEKKRNICMCTRQSAERRRIILGIDDVDPSETGSALINA